jgi:ferredoxin
LYNEIIGFFMTGTGNSYKVVKWFLETANVARSELCQIRDNQSDIHIRNSDLLVFSYPTHGFTAPWLMVKHIFRLPKVNAVHAVVLPMRAGTRMFGWSLPGMEGTAGYLVALLLWYRGYTVKGVVAIDMPSNWTAIHWGLNHENVQVISENGESKVKKIAHEILAGHSVYKGFIPFIIGIILSRISLIYLILAQLILSKLFFASNQCNGCRIRQGICPKQAITMIGNKPYWKYSCDSCMACMNYCPQTAIQVSSFSIFLFSYILSLPVNTWITDMIGEHIMAGSPDIVFFAIQYLYTLSSVAFVYLMLHHLLRSKPIAALMTGLSHTRYFRRYQAQGVSLKEIHKVRLASDGATMPPES